MICVLSALAGYVAGEPFDDEANAAALAAKGRAERIEIRHGGFRTKAGAAIAQYRQQGHADDLQMMLQRRVGVIQKKAVRKILAARNRQQCRIHQQIGGRISSGDEGKTAGAREEKIASGVGVALGDGAEYKQQDCRE